MDSRRPWITEGLQKWYDDGYKLLCEFRDEGLSTHPDSIPTQEWFRRRLDPLAFEYWMNWKPTYFNVSDDYYNSKSNEEKRHFIDQELNRWRVGLWVPVPAIQRMDPIEREDYKAKYPAPYVGGVQILAPTHYVQMNYMTLEVKGKGLVKPYYFRRAALYWDILDILSYYTIPSLGYDSYADRDLLMVFKTRGAHYSTNLRAQDLKNMITERSYSAGIAINADLKIQQYIRKLIRDFDTMPDWVKPTDPKGNKLYKATESKDNSRIEVRKWNPERGRVDSFYNEILVRGHKPSVWEDLRLDRFSIDEAGVSDQYDMIDLIDKGAACMRNERGERVGTIVVGGTSDANNQRNNPFFNRLKDSPKSYDAHLFFFGAQHIKGHDKETGWTPEQEIVKVVQERREEVREIGDIKKLTSITVIDPLTVHDCLYVKGNTYIDLERCQRQIDRIAAYSNDNSKDFEIQRGWFRAPNDEAIFNPVWTPDPNGGWHIISHPRRGQLRNIGRKPDVKYFAGADNVDMITDDEVIKQLNEGERSGLSRQACIIMDCFTNEPVAYYLYRHASPREDYRQTLLASMYYNCYFFPETNKPGNMNYFKEYVGSDGRVNNHFIKWLYPTPILYGGNYDRASKLSMVKFGIYTGNNKPKIYEEEVIPYMDEYTEQIWFPELLRVLISWNIENKHGTPDLGMAFLIALAGMRDFQSRVIPRESQNNKRMTPEMILKAFNR